MKSYDKHGIIKGCNNQMSNELGELTFTLK